jgi:hypothetical protein
MARPPRREYPPSSLPARIADRALLSLLGAVLVLATAIAALVGVAASGSPHKRSRPAGVAHTTSAVKKRAAERTAERSHRSAKRQRAASRQAYRHLSRAEAFDVAKRSHSRLLDHKRWRGLQMRGGEKVARYKDDQTALIDDGHGEQSLALAFFPLRAEGADGTVAPIDTTLTAGDGGFEPRRGVTDVLLHADVRRGALLDRSGVRAYPENAAAATGRAADDKLFAANVYTDTDYVEAALPNGVETFHQLRSAASPERLAFRFDMPAGARLEKTVDPANLAATGARVVRSGKVLATVSAPAAADADGEPVPVTFTVERDRLAMTVAHRDGDFRYPILVDPTIIENSLYWRDNSSIDFWGWYTGGNTPGQFGYTAGTRSPWGRGLHVYSASSTYSYPVDAYASWNWRAPRQSYIYRADFGAVNHTWNWDCIDQGIWATNNFNWESPPPDKYSAVWPDVYTPPYSPYHYGVRIVCANGAEASGGISTSNFYTMCPTGTCDPNFGTPGNIMVFSQRVEYGQAPRVNPMPASVMGGAAIYLNDRDNPVIDSTGRNTDSRWYRSGTMTVSPTAHDDGIGMNKFQLRVPGFAADYRSHPCLRARCPQYWSLPDSGNGISNYNYDIGSIPEGINTIDLFAHDTINKWTQTQWQLNVDRSVPWLNVYGALRDAVYAGTWSGAKTLWIQSADGTNDGNPANARSGVTSVEILVDGVRREYRQQSCFANCTLDFNWTFYADQYDPGNHAIQVIARDGAGNQRSSSTWTVSTTPTAGGTPDKSDPDAALSETVTPGTGEDDVCVQDVEQSTAPVCANSALENAANAEGPLAPPDSTGQPKIVPGSSNWGFADQGGFGFEGDPAKGHFDDPRWLKLGIKKLRVNLPWDIIQRANGPSTYGWWDAAGAWQTATAPQTTEKLEYYDRYMSKVRELMDLPSGNPTKVQELLIAVYSTETVVDFGGDPAFSLTERVLPDPKTTYIDNVKAIVNRYRGPPWNLPIKYIEAFNEPNHPSYAPSGRYSYPQYYSSTNLAPSFQRGAKKAAQYYNELRRWCNGAGACAAVAGSFADLATLTNTSKPDDQRYLYWYKRYLEKKSPPIWGYHAYNAATVLPNKSMTSSRLREFLERTKPKTGSSSVWLTEQGPLYAGTNGNQKAPACASLTGDALRVCQWNLGKDQTEFLMNLANIGTRIKRFYYYSFRGNVGSHDSGLVDPAREVRNPDGSPVYTKARQLRPAFCAYGAKTSPPFSFPADGTTIRACPYTAVQGD